MILKKLFSVMCSFYAMSVFGMLPIIEIDDGSGKYLQEYYAYIQNNNSENISKNECIQIFPITDSDIEYMYSYSDDISNNDYFIPSLNIVASAEEELKARMKDGNITLINKFLDRLDSTFGLLSNFRDKNFASAVFDSFANDIFLSIMSLESIAEEPNNDFSRQSMHIPYVVARIDATLQKVGKDIGLFEVYRLTYLNSDEFMKTPEYQHMLHAVEKVFCNSGFSLTDNQ